MDGSWPTVGTGGRVPPDHTAPSSALYKQVIPTVGPRECDLTNWTLQLKGTLWKKTKTWETIFPIPLLPRVQAVESSTLLSTLPFKKKGGYQTLVNKGEQYVFHVYKSAKCYVVFTF